MPVSHQILFRTGGGSRREEQRPCAAVAIGLGGTGVSCLRGLKRQVYSLLQPDDPNSPLPEYSHIRFLAIDSDSASLGAGDSLPSLDAGTEYFDLSCSSAHTLRNHGDIYFQRPEFAWLKREDLEKGVLSTLFPNSGAGGVRQIGRLLLMMKSSEFAARIQHLAEDAARGLPAGSGLEVHIFTGLGGGTGSGIFLDVCYLIQEVLARTSLGGRVFICGYVFLPDVNLSVPGIQADGSTARFIKSNGFAAMKELDYCMNLRSNHGCWEQEYHGFHTGPTQDPPVHTCFLISARDIRGRLLPEGFAHAINAASCFAAQSLVERDLPQGERLLEHIAHMGDCSSSVFVNDQVSGAGGPYCLLGASAAAVPMEEITVRLSRCLFAEISKGISRGPSEEEAAKFAEQNGLTFQQLLRSALDGTFWQMPVIPMDYKLPDLVCRDILKPLEDQAEVLFWRTPAFDSSRVFSAEYLFIPDSAPPVIRAAEVPGRTKETLPVCRGKAEDRILLLKCLRGVPMRAYQYLYECAEAYRKDRSAGRHLYERSGLDERDWRELPNPASFSKNAYPAQEAEQSAAQTRAGGL